MADVTQEDIRRVLAQLEREAEARRRAAEAAKPSFFGWLTGHGFGYIVQKIFGWAWTAIRSLFGF